MAVEHRPDGTTDGNALVETAREYGAALRGWWTGRYRGGMRRDTFGATSSPR